MIGTLVFLLNWLQAAWFIKVRALTLRDFIDDTDMEEQGIADIVMDENSIAKQPRPGTSLQAPMSDSSSKMGLRPMTGKQRPLTGFIRPSTSSKAGTGSALEQAFQVCLSNLSSLRKCLTRGGTTRCVCRDTEPAQADLSVWLGAMCDLARKLCCREQMLSSIPNALTLRSMFADPRLQK